MTYLSIVSNISENAKRLFGGDFEVGGFSAFYFTFVVAIFLSIRNVFLRISALVSPSGQKPLFKLSKDFQD